MSDQTSNRRQFLLASSAAVAGAVLLGSDFNSAPGGLATLAAAKGPRVPVAYIEGSEGAGSVADVLAARPRAVPAASLRGKATLSGKRAILAVHGFASPVHAANSPFASVFVDALIQSPAHRADTLPFYAFTFRAGGSINSSTTRLRLASGRGERVGVRVTTTGASTRTAHAVFGSARAGHVATVRPGIYLLGLQDGMFTRPVTLPAAGDAAWSELPSVVVVVEAEAAS